jgi:hypothetical protein
MVYRIETQAKIVEAVVEIRGSEVALKVENCSAETEAAPGV